MSVGRGGPGHPGFQKFIFFYNFLVQKCCSLSFEWAKM